MYLLTLIFHFGVQPSIETSKKICHQKKKQNNNKSNQIMGISAGTIEVWNEHTTPFTMPSPMQYVWFNSLPIQALAFWEVVSRSFLLVFVVFFFFDAHFFSVWIWNQHVFTEPTMRSSKVGTFLSTDVFKMWTSNLLNQLL